MSASWSLEQLNRASVSEFVQVLGGIFEHSPWVAEQVAPLRPFASVTDLHEAMVQQVEQSGHAAQLALIRAHPELAGKAALRGELTAESTSEQSSAGLDQCSPEEFSLLQQLNAEYNARFGFPFILAVRGYDRAGIIAQFQRRLALAPEAEQQECLQQIYRIAQLRLADLIRQGAALSHV